MSKLWDCGSCVSVVPSYGLDNRETGFDYLQRQYIFIIYTAVRPALGPIEALIQCVPRTLSEEVKRLGA
jgi:hypothetical protein